MWDSYFNTLAFFVDTSGGFTFQASNEWIPVAGEWNHLAVVRESGVITFYVNGTSYGANEEGGGTPSQSIPDI